MVVPESCAIVRLVDTKKKLFVSQMKTLDLYLMNYARTRRERMVLTAKFPLLNINLRARKPSAVSIGHRAWGYDKTHGHALSCWGAAPTAALGNTVNNQVIRNLLHNMEDFGQRTEEIEYALT